MSISRALSSAYLGTGSSNREGDESLNYRSDCSPFPSIFFQRYHSHFVTSIFLAVLLCNLTDTQKASIKQNQEPREKCTFAHPSKENKLIAQSYNHFSQHKYIASVCWSLFGKTKNSWQSKQKDWRNEVMFNKNRILS